MKLVRRVLKLAAMRWALATGLLAACAADPAVVPDPPTPHTTVRFLDDQGYRRSELEASLVNPDNAYSKLRLAKYAVDGKWDDLPEVVVDGLETDIDVTDTNEVVRLGERAFRTFPMQAVPLAHGAFGGGHFVSFDGATSETCATCHMASDGAPGLANASYDPGSLMVANGQATASNGEALLAWGPGRLDVTTTAGVEVVRIPDLRAVKFQRSLQADATVTLRDLDTLAIRIDTLIITSHDEKARAPRVVPYAIATYLWSLGDALPAPVAPPVFTATCAGCHAGAELAGDPVAIADVGTDPVVGDSLVRGTGTYGVPSLRGVGQRALLLHDGSVRSLEEMLDPASTRAGHRYGLDLSEDDRESIIAYLESL